jgi:hypothetical protein
MFYSNKISVSISSFNRKSLPLLISGAATKGLNGIHCRRLTGRVDPEEQASEKGYAQRKGEQGYGKSDGPAGQHTKA